jgi:PTH2 family peptidyl-tRNA hydrolase
MKQVIVVNKDLKMGKGKICAQVAHASLESFLNATIQDREKWLYEGAKKIVLKASLDIILEKAKKADQLSLPFAIITDAGLTQVEKGSITALAIGPAEDAIIDAITSDLKLL